MTTTSPIPPLLEAPQIERITPAEEVMIAAFDNQRRLNLLRILVPIIAIISLLSLPFAVYSGISSTLANHALSPYSTIESAAGLIPLFIAWWAVHRERVNLAAIAFFAGITVDILVVLITDCFFPGPLALRSIPEFALLVFPIAIAGLLGNGRFTILATVSAVVMTLGLIALTQHDVTLTNELEQPDGIVVYVIPLAVQLVLGVLIFAASVSLNQAQRELNATRLAYARELELDRMKNQFISNVNHELRTPIMALQGYLTIARELGARGDAQRQDQLLGRGMEALKNLSSLVESVLNVRQIESDQAPPILMPVEVRDAINKAISLLDPRETNGTERPLRLDLPHRLHVLAERERLSQVVLNLLSNACKYSPAGSPIDVTARILAQPVAKGAAAPAMAEISVRDYGLGVPPDKIPLLFERFVRLERDIASPVVGTGLGLAICRAAIEAMGGKIWVESTGIEGEGSTFTFVLPLAEG